EIIESSKDVMRVPWRISSKSNPFDLIIVKASLIILLRKWTGMYFKCSICFLLLCLLFIHISRVLSIVIDNWSEATLKLGEYITSPSEYGPIDSRIDRQNE